MHATGPPFWRTPAQATRGCDARWSPCSRSPRHPAGFSTGPHLTPHRRLTEWKGRSSRVARFGLYQMQARIGAGGMGEVYRARDTKLGRDVAIKVLPRAFTNDPERLARFEREARLLAALNHPHIGAIYGLEEADGVRGLVLELVPGETLAARLHRGPILLTETLTIARQITDALDTAHEKGIVHRDLKPANIKITPDGTVKVLDFGLAKFDVRGPDDGGVRPQSDLPWAPTTHERWNRGGTDPRHDGVHEPRADARRVGRQADRHLGVRLCALRDADRSRGIRERHDLGHDCGDPSERTRMERTPGCNPGFVEAPAATLRGEGSATSTPGYRRCPTRA